MCALDDADGYTRDCRDDVCELWEFVARDAAGDDTTLLRILLDDALPGSLLADLTGIHVKAKGGRA